MRLELSQASAWFLVGPEIDRKFRSLDSRGNLADLRIFAPYMDSFTYISVLLSIVLGLAIGAKLRSGPTPVHDPAAADTPSGASPAAPHSGAHPPGPRPRPRR